MGVFARIMTGLAAQGPANKTISIDATYLKAHRTASSLGAKKGAWPADRANKGRYEHQAARRDRRTWATHPVTVTAGQVSDYTGARACWTAFQTLTGSWATGTMTGTGPRSPCRQEDNARIPGRKSRDKPVKYDKRRYRKRNRIEIMLQRSKDWRALRRAMTEVPGFLSAIALAEP